MNHLYACSQDRNEQCYSWDFMTGEKSTHQPFGFDTDSCSFTIVEVNGKIWLTGGYDHYFYQEFDDYYDYNYYACN